MPISGLGGIINGVISDVGSTVTVKHRYSTEVLPSGETQYAWGGTGHEDSEKITFWPFPQTVTMMEGSKFGPMDRMALFRSDTTVEAYDQILISTIYYRVEAPIEVYNFLGLGQILVFLKYLGT